MDWPGFSPGPVSVTMSPEHAGFEFSHVPQGGAPVEQSGSPLMFTRTPGVARVDSDCPDSTKRFNSWMECTSPYAAHKTPPSASMKSLRAGDENTPPAPGMADAEQGGSVGSQQHFQAWLRATHSTSWTPRKSPAAATPPPPPAPSPATTPMSVMRDLQHSAATPPSTRRPAGALQHTAMGDATAAAAAAAAGFTSSDEDEDAGEASTTIGAAQVAAATDRAAVVNRIAGGRAAAGRGSSSTAAPLQPQLLSTPPRVPAPSPVAASSAGLAYEQHQVHLLQAAADRMVQDSLATPMSHLSINRRPPLAEHAAAAGSLTPGVLVERGTGSGAAALPASPAEKLIGLMLSPGGADSHRRCAAHQHTHHGDQHHMATPSRLSAAVAGSDAAQAPRSPNLQVIDLMLQAAAGPEPQPAAPAGMTAAPRSSTGTAALAAAGAEGQQVSQAGGTATADGASSDGSSWSSGSDVDESDDEMDLLELQALCGEGVGPDTPLSAILGMMLTPQAAGLTPRTAAPGDGDDDSLQRVLFGDD